MIGIYMYDELEKINARPKPFEFYTASDLWTDEHTSKMMLSYHLNTDIDVSRNKDCGFRLWTGIIYNETRSNAGKCYRDRFF